MNQELEHEIATLNEIIDKLRAEAAIQDGYAKAEILSGNKMPTHDCHCKQS